MEQSLRASQNNAQLMRYRRMMYGGHNLVGYDVTQGLGMEYKVTGSSYDVYTINVAMNNTISCDCPDALCDCNGAGCYCKHICYVLIKVGKLSDPSVFQRKQLTSYEKNQLFNRTLNIMTDIDVVNPVLVDAFRNAQKAIDNQTQSVHITNKIFDAMDARNLDHDCAVCYNKLEKGKETGMCCCPTCNNAFHKDCILNWLKIKKSCVMCCTDKDWKNVQSPNHQVSHYVNISTYIPVMVNMNIF